MGASSLLPFLLYVRLIGQPWFHSTSFLLHLHIVCLPFGRVENEEFEGERKRLKENVSYKRSLAYVNKLQTGVHYVFLEKAIRLHNTDVWNWVASIQHTKST